MFKPAHGNGWLRDSPLMDKPPELRCVAISRSTGQRCKDIRVRGHTCCRAHGGGAEVVRRYRAELADICAGRRAGRVRAGRLAWLIQRLARTERNRPRAHDANYERANAAESGQRRRGHKRPLSDDNGRQRALAQQVIDAGTGAAEDFGRRGDGKKFGIAPSA
ncbi:hypothetical protein BOSEA31B_10941 [Hyphomicrobiales bacterium]|nr:hypothetical protein BOSEA31B_10941 [Hyphomicrobiales bacterium]CAH1700792.1 hypothetical protein BOSEA1005_20491 [Hyphomicrobiales bacterium]CAI0344665.1 hypothetical protein BO1005MUT1_350032 [Hyphomicrobiales bacterium]